MPDFFGKGTKLDYVFTGFRQEKDVRVYAFECVQADRSRSRVSVGADMQLLRKYKIAVQELPLLCRRFLEERTGDVSEAAIVFSEEQMQAYVNRRSAALAEAALKRKPYRKPSGAAIGQAWRGPAR